MKTVRVTFNDDEYEALKKAACSERRTVPLHVAFLAAQSCRKTDESVQIVPTYNLKLEPDE